MIKFTTTKLQEMVSKAFKGVGNNKLRPITELISLKCSAETEGKMVITTTDGDNFMYVSENPIQGENFYAVVQANQFSKLISKLTSEFVTMDVVNNCLEIESNGKYRIPVEIDHSTGQIVDYTDPVKSLDGSAMERIGTISSQDIATILRAVKPALAVTAEIPEYMNYYLGETVLGTDTNMASCYGKEITSTPVLVSAAVMEMLNVFAGDALEIYKIGNKLLFSGENFKLLGYVMPGVDDFQIDKINDYVNTEYPSKCKIPKQEMLQALDRLSLFVSDFDENEIDLAFTSDGLQLSSKQSDSVETIGYLGSENLEETQCTVYLDMLTSHIKAQTGDSIDICYGDGNSIKFVDDACQMISVICLVH